MAKQEYRGPSYEVAEYDHARRRIILSTKYDEALPALEAYCQLLIDNEVPAPAVVKIHASLQSSLLKGVTLFDHECLATNRRVSFIIRK